MIWKKTYYQIDWNALFDIMQAMNFPARWIHWIRACVTNAKYSLLINRKPTRRFQPSSGIRKGDPLSPTLFIELLFAPASNNGPFKIFIKLYCHYLHFRESYVPFLQIKLKFFFPKFLIRIRQLIEFGQKDIFIPTKAR